MKTVRPFVLVIITLVVFLLLTVTVVGSKVPQRLFQQRSTAQPTPSPTQSPELQVCPDKWYRNEQPCVYRESPAECAKEKSEYFIVDGQRKEVEDMDVEWIRDNCQVNQPEITY